MATRNSTKLLLALANYDGVVWSLQDFKCSIGIRDGNTGSIRSVGINSVGGPLQLCRRDIERCIANVVPHVHASHVREMTVRHQSQPSGGAGGSVAPYMEVVEQALDRVFTTPKGSYSSDDSDTDDSWPGEAATDLELAHIGRWSPSSDDLQAERDELLGQKTLAGQYWQPEEAPIEDVENYPVFGDVTSSEAVVPAPEFGGASPDFDNSSCASSRSPCSDGLSLGDSMEVAISVETTPEPVEEQLQEEAGTGTENEADSQADTSDSDSGDGSTVSDGVATELADELEQVWERLLDVTAGVQHNRPMTEDRVFVGMEVAGNLEVGDKDVMVLHLSCNVVGPVTARRELLATHITVPGKLCMECSAICRGRWMWFTEVEGGGV